MSRPLQLADHERALVLAFRKLGAATRAWQRSDPRNKGDAVCLQVYPDGSMQVLVVEVERIGGVTREFPVLDERWDVVDALGLLDTIADEPSRAPIGRLRVRKFGDSDENGAATYDATDKGRECER